MKRDLWSADFRSAHLVPGPTGDAVTSQSSHLSDRAHPVFSVSEPTVYEWIVFLYHPFIVHFTTSQNSGRAHISFGFLNHMHPDAFLDFSSLYLHQTSFIHSTSMLDSKDQLFTGSICLFSGTIQNVFVMLALLHAKINISCCGHSWYSVSHQTFLYAFPSSPSSQGSNTAPTGGGFIGFSSSTWSLAALAHPGDQ